MNGPDWQARARRLAATVFLVAVALHVAVDLLRSTLPFLFVGAVVVVGGMAVVAVIRARRGRW